MKDVLETLKKAKEVIEQTKDPYIRSLLNIDDLLHEIDEALENPEMRIETPAGNLVVALYDSTQQKEASVLLENENSGQIDLFNAVAMIDPELVEIYENEGVKEAGDIRMLMYEDIWNEDYTKSSVIKVEDIRELEKTMKEKLGDIEKE